MLLADSKTLVTEGGAAMAITIPAITRTDEQIQRDVLAELKWDARVQPNEVGVSLSKMASSR